MVDLHRIPVPRHFKCYVISLALIAVAIGVGLGAGTRDKAPEPQKLGD